MTEPRRFEPERKAVKKLAKAAEALSTALRDAAGAADNLDEHAFVAVSAASDAIKAIGELREAPQVLEPIEAGLAAFSRDAEAAAERSRARLMGALDDALRARGLELAGRLPALKCGPLTLELTGGPKPEMVIYYGPRVEVLERTAVDVAEVVKAAVAVMEALEPGPLDDAAYLTELHTAWRVALVREGLAAGDKAPITAVLAEMAAGRQSAGWREDPTKKRFSDYSRVRFSHDLGRLKARSAGGRELVLTVATRDQTKKPADHLWVQGTHYAYLSFRGA